MENKEHVQITLVEENYWTIKRKFKTDPEFKEEHKRKIRDVPEYREEWRALCLKNLEARERREETQMRAKWGSQYDSKYGYKMRKRREKREELRNRRERESEIELLGENPTQPVLDEPEDTDDISEEITALRRIRQEATISICKIQSVEETMHGWASIKHQSESDQCEDTYTLTPIDEW